jgi:hypothetical protein
MTDLMAMNFRLQAADVHDKSRILGKKDGKLDLNSVIKMADGSYNFSDGFNPEASETRKIIEDSFGLKDSIATYFICKYFDKLDGEDDNIIDLKELKKFVKNISKNGAAKDKFVRYLEEHREHQKFIAEHSHMLSFMRNPEEYLKNVKDLQSVIDQLLDPGTTYSYSNGFYIQEQKSPMYQEFTEDIFKSKDPDQ